MPPSVPVPIHVDPHPTFLPLFVVRVCAGSFPSPAEDHLDEPIDLTQLLVGHPASTFLWRVQGWCMQDAGIFDGDILVVDRALSPKAGDVVVAVVDGDPLVKRATKVAGRLVLRNENATMAPFVVHDGAQVDVWGVVTCNLRIFRR